MKKIKNILIISFSIFFIGISYAGDKEDIQTAVNKAIDAFNNRDYTTYFSLFTNDNTEFPYVVSPLRHDAAAWKNFIEGTSSLEYVNYQQQDEMIQVYNNNSAVVTAYYKFTWKEKEGTINYQSGRASFVLVKQNSRWLTAHMHFSEMF